MKRHLIAAALIIGGLSIPATAHAADTTPACDMPTGWYANLDEQDRLPTPTEDGLKFEGSDLIHHVTDGTVEDLTPGTFAASPAPDQDSFFSVEVSGADGGYGTLRWNTSTSKWNLVTGGQFYENADAAALVDMPAAHRSHHVTSFGVGYTENPPGTVATTVSSVTYGGHTYELGCTPPVTATTSPTATASSSAKPTAKPTAKATSPKASASATAVAGSGSLPVTGPPTALIGAMAGGLLLGGAMALLLASRRRKNRFIA